MSGGGVWRTKNTRLGVDMSTESIGWCLVKRSRPKPSRIETGDMLTVARRAAAERAAFKESLTIYIYATDEAFAGSRGAAVGMTRESHCEAMEEIAQTLADEGYRIILCEVD